LIFSLVFERALQQQVDIFGGPKKAVLNDGKSANNQVTGAVRV
jgi:hypothetical protein